MFAQLQKTMNPFPTNLLKYCFKPDVLLINESETFINNKYQFIKEKYFA